MQEQRQRIKTPPDNYGRLYIALLESDTTSLARLCYAVMWSFGQDCWASIPSIARRMNTSENTVRKCQIELQGTHWIVLVDSKDGVGKTWEMQTPETRKTLLNTPSPGEGLPLHDMKGTPSPGEGLPLHGVTYKKERNQEPKELKQTAANAAKDPAKHPNQDSCWLGLKALWSERFNGAALKWPAMHFKGWQKIFTEALESLGEAEILRRWKICIYDPWSRPSLRVFFNDLDKWMEARGQSAPEVLEEYPAGTFDPAREWRIQSKKHELAPEQNIKSLIELRQKCKGIKLLIVCDMIEEYFNVEFYGRNGRSLRAFLNQFERLHDKHKERD
jgi:hypothetical protein